MLDQRGVKRSFCTECNGEERCEEFEMNDKTPFCGYCGCPPIKHKRIDLSTVPNQPKEVTPEAVSLPESSNIEVVSNSVPIVEEINSVAVSTDGKGSLNALIPELPQFSKCVAIALSSGGIYGSLWSNMIMQCASYYLKCDDLKTKTKYDLLGRKMFETYPCIEGPGPKPWSHFTKCLSQKIRTERLKIKSFTSMKEKDFTNIANENSSRRTNGRQASAESKRTYFRSEANVASTLSEEEIPTAKKNIITEWQNESPVSGLIKSLLRDTFHVRSDLLKQGVSFDEFLKNYPCFQDEVYVLYEFSMLLGRNKMADLTDKMKTFFVKLRNLTTDGSTEGDLMLSDWMWFEKKCGNFQTKGEKSAPIVNVIMDSAEYREMMLKNYDYPTGVILLIGNVIKDCAVVYESHFIQCKSLNIISLLTVLLALYYILEINYPKRHLQAMGALANIILSHEFYKLGQRAGQMIRRLK